MIVCGVIAIFMLTMLASTSTTTSVGVVKPADQSVSLPPPKPLTPAQKRKAAEQSRQEAVMEAALDEGKGINLAKVYENSLLEGV
jgi:hypothetical protein